MSQMDKKSNKIYYKQEAGRWFTTAEFLKYLPKKTLETIQKWNMFKRDSRIAVAVSGGKDSTTLLHILEKIEREFPSKLFIIHINEEIENYSELSEEKVRNSAEKLNLPVQIVSIEENFGYSIDKVASFPQEERTYSTCSYCGVWRRWLMNHVAQKFNADRLVTAHCLDDEAQTILLSVLRGSLTNLLRLKTSPKAIPGVVPRVKPFRAIPEKEITLYAHLRGIDYNDKECPHAEEGMRWDIRQWLYRQEEKHPGTYHAILNLGTEISRRCEEPRNQTIQKCEICDYPASGRLCQAHMFKKKLQEQFD